MSSLVFDLLTLAQQSPRCSPGFLDIQINGAYNFDFSVYEGDDETYRTGLHRVAEKIVETGVTS